MLSVKIEFFPFDWYSGSPAATVLYNKMYSIYAKCFQAIAKSLKKENAIYMK